MIFVGVDPGHKSPTHALQADDGPISISPTPFFGHFPDAVFVEGQYAPQTSSRQSLMTLSFYAGLQAGAYLAQNCPVYVLKPDTWKPALIKGRNTTKTIFQNRCLREGLVSEAIWQLGPDAVDAALILLAGRRLLEKGKKLERLKWKK